MLFSAASFEDALAKGEAEAKRYIAIFDAPMRCQVLNHLVAYYIHSAEPLRDGDEVWSCVRELETTDDQFLKKVFEDETESFTNVHRQGFQA